MRTEDPDVVALQTVAKQWLRPWERVGSDIGGITQEQVSKVFAFLQRGKGVGSLRIQVVNGVLQEPTVVKEWLKTKVYYPPRIKHWMALFRHIETTHGLPDFLDIIVCTEDQAFLPASFEHIGGAPIFTYASTLGHYDIPMPTMEYYGNKVASGSIGEARSDTIVPFQAGTEQSYRSAFLRGAKICLCPKIKFAGFLNVIE